MVRELPPAVRVWPRWGAQKLLSACACACQVLYCKENMAIISGLNSDAPIGTKLSFVTGGTGYDRAAGRRPQMSGREARLRVRAHQQVSEIKRYSQSGKRWTQQLFCAVLQWCRCSPVAGSCAFETLSLTISVATQGAVVAPQQQPGICHHPGWRIFDQGRRSSRVQDQGSAAGAIDDGLVAHLHWLVSAAGALPCTDPGHEGGLWHSGQAAARHLALAREMKT